MVHQEMGFTPPLKLFFFQEETIRTYARKLQTAPNPMTEMALRCCFQRCSPGLSGLWCRKATAANIVTTKVGTVSCCLL